jgi:rare lipoprotein A
MIKQVCISTVLVFICMSCASSTRFTSRHASGDDTNNTADGRYENKSKVNDYSNILESRVGVASYYSDKYQGKKTSSGEIFDQDKLTAAHPTYSMGTIVRVKNLKNRKTVVVRINDRMTNRNGRIIDLSRRAAEELGMIKNGIAKVQVDVLKWGSSK